MEKKETKKKKFTNLIKSASEAFYHSKTDERDNNGEIIRKYKFRLSISSPKEETSSPDEIIIKNPTNFVTPTKQDTQEVQKKIRALKILQKMTEVATDEVNIKLLKIFSLKPSQKLTLLFVFIFSHFFSQTSDSVSPTLSLSNIFSQQKQTLRKQSKSPRELTPREKLLQKKKIGWNSMNKKVMEEILNQQFYENPSLSKSSPALFSKNQKK
jgi:acyl carrier protein phosphodiesterase